ncbi:nitroreductase family protein [Actinokineospora sp. UTMC 2448]|uniref:nitroreductase family protein n=1 Tax=Actinokineospora sp. UTMC 2448 TaxID=2268449 RepID=UPI002164B3FE|nr:nitroreductase family protein [Actinokineospora sp. UTMC 2448]UVS76553.1 malonic semialdehyde reductase [Actinokineospora sp. UTMC 2448]
MRSEPHPLIAARWSPRALDPDGVVAPDALRRMLEAARWAPSYGNTQPARYLVGPRGTSTFDRILALLNTGNRAWAFRAGALLVSCAQTANDKGEVPYAEYGVGLATENLVLQAVAEGLVAHQMAGFDKAGVSAEFGLPETVRPLTAIAVGVLGPPELLAPEKRERETRPRRRIPAAELSFTDAWGTPYLSPDAG